MAGSVNKVILIGNLGKDPEIRRTQDGRPIANLRVATTETWRDKTSGERREKTEWHSVVIFNEGLCRVAEQYLKKGAKVYIEGQLQTRKWQGQDGQDRYSTEVVLQNFNSTLTMLDTRGAGTGATAGAAGATVQHRQRAAEALQHDLGRVALLAALVLPFARLQLALDVDFGAFLQILLHYLAQWLAEDHDAMPLGLFLALAGGLVAPAFAGGDVEIGDRAAVLGAADLRILAQIADQNDLVDRACHCSLHTYLRMI